MSINDRNPILSFSFHPCIFPFSSPFSPSSSSSSFPPFLLLCASTKLTKNKKRGRENSVKLFHDLLIKTPGRCKLRNRPRIDTESREICRRLPRAVLVVLASRYWNFYEGVLIEKDLSRIEFILGAQTLSGVAALIKFYLSFIHACMPLFL